MSLLLCSNLKQARWSCFNNYDLGIYHQSLIEIAAGKSWNPYLTVRGLPAFNDHFNPASIIGAAFLKLTSLSVEFTIFWEWLTFLLGLLVFWIRRGGSKKDETVLAFFFLSFSGGILNALQFPVHIDFWSVPIWALAVSAWLEKRDLEMLAWFSCLGFFKESFPFCFLTFGVYLLFLDRKPKVASATFALGLALLALGFTRPLWLGPVHPYGPVLLRPILENPVAGIQQALTRFEYKEFFHLFLPLGLLIAWHLSNLRRHSVEKKQWLGIAFLLLPLFAIQVLFATFSKHYSFPFFICSLFLIFHQGGFRRILERPQVLTFFIIAFCLSGFHHYRKSFEVVVLDKCDKCILSSEKRQSQQDLVRLFTDLVKDEKVASTGGILVPLLRPGLQIFHIHSHSEPQSIYTYLLLERNGSGDSYPLSAEQVETVLAACRPFAEQVLQENRFFFFARGNFPHQCLGSK